MSCTGHTCVGITFGQAPVINVLVRDSKDPGGPVLEFTPGDRSRFLEEAKAEKFDPLTDLAPTGDRSC